MVFPLPRSPFWLVRAQRWLDELSAERLSWFGAGLTVAAAGCLAYVLVVAPLFAAQATPAPPRPQPAPVRVQVVGEVHQPGSYDLPHTARVEDAVQVAGGLTEHADVAYLNLAARVMDGQRVVVSRLRVADGGRAYPTRSPPERSPAPAADRTPRPTAEGTPQESLDRAPGASPERTPRPTTQRTRRETPERTPGTTPERTPRRSTEATPRPSVIAPAAGPMTERAPGRPVVAT